jgi:hypothetical protein
MEPAIDPMTGQPAMGPDGQPAMQPVMDPRTGQPVIENDVGALDIDIIIDMTPEYASLQQEEFQSLVELMKSGAVQFPPDVLIEASSLRNKRKIIEKMNDPQQQQMQQAAMQLEMQGKQAEIAKVTAETEKMAAETQLKQAQLQIDAKHAELDELKMKFEAQKAQADQANGERESQAKAAEMAFKQRELELKAQEAALQPPLIAVEIKLKDAQAQKTLAEIGKVQADIELGRRQQDSAEQGMSADRELKSAELGLKAKSEDNKVSMAKDAAKGDEPKKPKKARFTVKRNKDGLIEALDREDME